MPHSQTPCTLSARHTDGEGKKTISVRAVKAVFVVFFNSICVDRSLTPRLSPARTFLAILEKSFNYCRFFPLVTSSTRRKLPELKKRKEENTNKLIIIMFAGVKQLGGRQGE